MIALIVAFLLAVQRLEMSRLVMMEPSFQSWASRSGIWVHEDDSATVTKDQRLLPAKSIVLPKGQAIRADRTSFHLVNRLSTAYCHRQITLLIHAMC
jgi:hypothetical protein